MEVGLEKVSSSPDSPFIRCRQTRIGRLNSRIRKVEGAQGEGEILDTLDQLWAVVCMRTHDFLYARAENPWVLQLELPEQWCEC